jgi:heat shock protein HslJ
MINFSTLKSSAVVVVAAILLNACSPKISSNNPLFTNFWVLVELNGVPVQTSNSSRDAHLQFSYIEKTMSGSGGCNRITATYDLPKKNKIKINEITSTKMYCQDSRFEDLFLRTLREVDNYQLNNDTELVMRDDNKVVARFTHH